jgi:hypothetical protein
MLFLALGAIGSTRVYISAGCASESVAVASSVRCPRGFKRRVRRDTPSRWPPLSSRSCNKLRRISDEAEQARRFDKQPVGVLGLVAAGDQMQGRASSTHEVAVRYGASSDVSPGQLAALWWAPTLAPDDRYPVAEWVLASQFALAGAR